MIRLTAIAKRMEFEMDDKKQVLPLRVKNIIKIRRSIARDLVISLSTAVAVVLILAIALNYCCLVRKTRAQFEGKANELMTFFQNSLVLPLWNYDDEGINETCEMFLENELVVSVKVTDSLGKIIFENKSSEETETIKRSGQIDFKGQDIGTAEISLTNRVCKENNLQTLNTSLMILLIVVVLLIFFTAMFLNIFLRAPLRELLSRIDHIGKGEYSQVPATSKQKEVVEIMAQFDRMALKVKAREIALGTSNEKLTAEISKHLTTEKALRESEHRFKNIIELLPEAIFEVDIEMKFTFVNQQAYAMFGYTKEDIKNGLTFLDVIHQEDRDKAIENYAARLEGVKKGAVEYRGLRKDGSIFPILLNTASIILNGCVTGLRGVVVDITMRKKIDEKLAKEQRMSSLGSLAGGIAHDFNNTLQPLMGFCELLKVKTPADSPKIKYIDGIFDASIRAKELVHQILAFSRPSEHKKEPVRMESILKEVTKLIRATIPSIIEIHQDIQPDCGPVMADSIQLHQVAMNLIVNAYHAVEKSGGSISVRLNEVMLEEKDITYGTLQPGRYARLTVSDTGCGIDPAIVDKIFDPYFTTKEEGKGTGLGLSVVYGIVQDYKGNIDVSSTVGKGTTFDVLIPVTKSLAETTSTKNGHVLQTGNEHVLLVDDEVPILTFEKKMLERLGYHVTSCSDSIEALKIFKAYQDSIDLVITDMNMPKMTGDQLISELIAIRPDISIIICSGFSHKFIMNQSLSSVVKEFLLKPVTAAELSRVVRKVLDEWKALEVC